MYKFQYEPFRVALLMSRMTSSLLSIPRESTFQYVCACAFCHLYFLPFPAKNHKHLTAYIDLYVSSMIILRSSPYFSDEEKPVEKRNSRSVLFIPTMSGPYIIFVLASFHNSPHNCGLTVSCRWDTCAKWRRPTYYFGNIVHTDIVVTCSVLTSSQSLTVSHFEYNGCIWIIKTLEMFIA